MRKAIWRVGVAVLALFMVAPAAAADQGRGSGGRPSVVPAGHVSGSSGGALLGDWMAQLLAIPAPQNPLAQNAELCLDLGPNGKVLSPAGGKQDAKGNIKMKCEVEPGQSVLMVMPVGECSAAEDPPYHAETEPDQQACAIDALKSLQVTSITLQVDRERPVEIRNNRFLTVSPQGTAVLPANPVWGRPGETTTFAAASWTAEIRGLTKGNHVVVGTTKAIQGGSEISLEFIVRFTVGGRGH